jgi:hypothetical protein
MHTQVFFVTVRLWRICQSLGSYSLGGQPKYLPISPGPLRLVAGDQIIVRTEA